MTHIVDIYELARRGDTFEGEAPVADMPRLCAFLADGEGVLHYKAEGLGEIRGRPAARLTLTGEVNAPCARCLKGVPVELESEGVFVFTKDEAELNSMPIVDDVDWDDATIGSRRFSMKDWAEEEAILSLPQAVYHEECEDDAWEDDEPEAEEKKRPNPFAALAALKDGK